MPCDAVTPRAGRRGGRSSPMWATTATSTFPSSWCEGYSTLFQEVDEQLDAAGWPAPDLVLIPGGVGGILHAGVVHYAGRSGVRVVGVEPSSADCLTTSLESIDGRPTVATGDGVTTMACLNCAEVSLSSWPAIRTGVDAMVAIDDSVAAEGVRLLYRSAPGDTALEAGPSGRCDHRRACGADARSPVAWSPRSPGRRGNLAGACALHRRRDQPGRVRAMRGWVGTPATSIAHRSSESE